MLLDQGGSSEGREANELAGLAGWAGLDPIKKTKMQRSKPERQRAKQNKCGFDYADKYTIKCSD